MMKFKKLEDTNSVRFLENGDWVLGFDGDARHVRINNVGDDSLSVSVLKCLGKETLYDVVVPYVEEMVHFGMLGLNGRDRYKDNIKI